MRSSPINRILYISPRPFGLIATPGTYLNVEGYSKLSTIKIIAAPVEENHVIVHKAGSSIDIKELSPVSKSYLHDVLDICKEFEPNVVCIASSPRWHQVAKIIKENGGKSVVLLEAKAPNLEEASDSLKRKQSVWTDFQKYIDGIVTPSKAVAETFIPEISVPVVEHGLTIDIDKIRFNHHKENRNVYKLVFSGSLSKKRKLDKLFKMLSNLDSDTIKKIELDVYGAGPESESLERLACSLGLPIRFKGAVEQTFLYSVYSEYDAGIAWVPKELYNMAPSLKLIEYCASGIAPIATATEGHRNMVSCGFDVKFFEEGDDFSLNRLLSSLVRSEGFQVSAKENRDRAKRFDYNEVVREVIFPFMEKLVHGKYTSSGVANDKQKDIVFVSHRPFGVIATPGVYLAIEAYSEKYSVHTICGDPRKSNEPIVFNGKESGSFVYLESNDRDYFQKVLDEIGSCNPRFVIVASSPQWGELVIAIKRAFPKVPVFLEVKSPIIDSNTYRVARRRLFWQSAQQCLAGVVAPSLGMIRSYIPQVYIPFLEHRSLIDKSLFERWNGRYKDEDHKIRLVFSGSLGRQRQIDKLLDMIYKLPQHLKESIKMDVYGDGPARLELQEQVRKSGISYIVNFKGTVSQEKMIESYSSYDVGIAWVPRRLYDSAPSLKLVEYCAAGLIPVATSSSGHLFMRKYDFQVEYFDEGDVASLAELLNKIKSGNLSKQDYLKNVRNAENNDYRNVVAGEIAPFYEEVIRSSVDGALSCHQPYNSVSCPLLKERVLSDARILSKGWGC